MPSISGNVFIDTLIFLATGAGVFKGIEQFIASWQKRTATLQDSETGDIVQLRKDVWDQIADARDEQRRQRTADALTIESLRKEVAALTAARIIDAQTIGELRGQITALQTEVAMLKLHQTLKDNKNEQ